MNDFPANGKPTPAIPAPVEPSGSNPLLIAFAWLIVAIPLFWGVLQTGKTSMALFESPPPAHAGK